MVARYKRTKRRSGRKTQRRRRTTQRRRKNIRHGGMGDDRTEFYVRSNPTFYTDQVVQNFGYNISNAKRGQPGFADPYFRWPLEKFDERIATAQKLKKQLEAEHMKRTNERAAYITRMSTDKPTSWSVNRMWNKVTNNQAGRDQYLGNKITTVKSKAQVEEPDYEKAIELLDSIINEMKSEKEIVARNE